MMCERERYSSDAFEAKRMNWQGEVLLLLLLGQSLCDASNITSTTLRQRAAEQPASQQTQLSPQTPPCSTAPPG